MLSTISKVFGVALLAAGVLGFIPAFTPNGRLLGLFEVNGLHNLIHLSSGVVALWTGFSSEAASRKYFQIFGVLYALITVLGVFYGDRAILGLVAHNTADIFLHIVIAGSALVLGFGSFGSDRATVTE
jgi:hypothetical protein